MSPPRRAGIFLQFYPDDLGATFLVVTLNFLTTFFLVYFPSYSPSPFCCSPSFTPRYTAFHYQWALFTPWWALLPGVRGGLRWSGELLFARSSVYRVRCNGSPTGHCLPQTIYCYTALNTWQQVMHEWYFQSSTETAFGSCESHEHE